MSRRIAADGFGRGGVVRTQRGMRWLIALTINHTADQQQAQHALPPIARSVSHDDMVVVSSNANRLNFVGRTDDRRGGSPGSGMAIGWLAREAG